MARAASGKSFCCPIFRFHCSDVRQRIKMSFAKALLLVAAAAVLGATRADAGPGPYYCGQLQFRSAPHGTMIISGCTDVIGGSPTDANLQQLSWVAQEPGILHDLQFCLTNARATVSPIPLVATMYISPT